LSSSPGEVFSLIGKLKEEHRNQNKTGREMERWTMVSLHVQLPYGRGIHFFNSTVPFAVLADFKLFPTTYLQ
jgi:hypothetical protein